VRSCCWSLWYWSSGNWCFQFPLSFLSSQVINLGDQINYIKGLMKALSF
jgi:hypothetical protein